MIKIPKIEIFIGPSHKSALRNDVVFKKIRQTQTLRKTWSNGLPGLLVSLAEEGGQANAQD
jgi:hypothetical protein